jgi:hypothetical protein
MYDFAGYLVYQLPSPRYEFYQSSSFADVQENILNEEQKLIDDLGFYPISA